MVNETISSSMESHIIIKKRKLLIIIISKFIDYRSHFHIFDLFDSICTWTEKIAGKSTKSNYNSKLIFSNEELLSMETER